MDQRIIDSKWFVLVEDKLRQNKANEQDNMHNINIRINNTTKITGRHPDKRSLSIHLSSLPSGPGLGPNPSAVKDIAWAVATVDADCYLRQGDGGTKTARFGSRICFLR